MEVAEKGESEEDESAAKRFWDLHLLRNDSVIVDLFHGQYRSTITCPECHRVSITYDPFTNVSLPIPELTKVDIYFVPFININKTLKLSIYISNQARFFDILHYINTNTNLDNKVSRVRCMLVSNNKCVKMASPSNLIVELSKDGYIFCYEVDPSLKDDFINIPVHIYAKDELKTFPRMFNIDADSSIEELKVKAYGFMRRYLKMPDEFTKITNDGYQTLLSQFEINAKFESDFYSKVIREEYNALFNIDNNNVISEELRSEIIKSFPYEFRYGDVNLFDTNKDDLETKMKGISLSGLNLTKNICINITGELDPDRAKALSSCLSYASKDNSKSLALNDCFEHFRLTEKLEKNNEWYCGKCKKHQQAFKKLELFYTPKILILHLKRFSYSSVSRYRMFAEKLGQTIDFPLDNLDLSNYVVGPTASSQYELFAVSQHFGSTGGGHYTSVCKNYDGKWYDFNDSTVRPTSPSNVVSSAAYLLFYRRKE
jgi:hypothetical protein